jgi:hypothetical protein
VSRRTRLVLAATVLVAFLGVSFLLARWLTTENRERDAVYALLKDQASGDAPAMLTRLDDCTREPRCAATVRDNARRLKRPGELKILSYESGTSYALGEASGVTRVAWTVVDRGLPVVQCVAVERGGTVLAGRVVTLRRLSPPIGRQSSC